MSQKALSSSLLNIFRESSGSRIAGTRQLITIDHPTVDDLHFFFLFLPKLKKRSTANSKQRLIFQLITPNDSATVRPHGGLFFFPQLVGAASQDASHSCSHLHLTCKHTMTPALLWSTGGRNGTQKMCYFPLPAGWCRSKNRANWPSELRPLPFHRQHS